MTDSPKQAEERIQKKLNSEDRIQKISDSRRECRRWNVCMYIPERVSRRVDLPEPEGPMMAMIWPGSAYPFNPWRRCRLTTRPPLLPGGAEEDWTVTHRSFQERVTIAAEEDWDWDWNWDCVFWWASRFSFTPPPIWSAMATDVSSMGCRLYVRLLWPFVVLALLLLLLVCWLRRSGAGEFVGDWENCIFSANLVDRNFVRGIKRKQRRKDEWN